MDHEQAFVSAFIVPEKRGRYAEFLPKPKRRTEITDRFCHFLILCQSLRRQLLAIRRSRLCCGSEALVILLTSLAAEMVWMAETCHWKMQLMRR